MVVDIYYDHELDYNQNQISVFINGIVYLIIHYTSTHYVVRLIGLHYFCLTPTSLDILGVGESFLFLLLLPSVRHRSLMIFLKFHGLTASLTSQTRIILIVLFLVFFSDAIQHPVFGYFGTENVLTFACVMHIYRDSLLTPYMGQQ